MSEFDDFGEVKSLEEPPSPAIRPFHGLFAFIKSAAGIVWLVLVIMVRTCLQCSARLSMRTWRRARCRCAREKAPS